MTRKRTSKSNTDSTGPTGESKRRPNGTFGPGNKANPRGNPQLRRLAEYRDAVHKAISPNKLHNILVRLTKLAEDGDVIAAKVLLDRTLGKVRATTNSDALAAVDLPSIACSSDAVAASNAILDALNAGRISAEDASRLANIVELARRTIETHALTERVEALEDEIKSA